ncbi:MAG: shikimate dehydrogenase, partial [Acidimicrobiales bacterium]|nr:shikimate dehydrogenase [Acidimicrobiales bacterium]
MNRPSALGPPTGSTRVAGVIGDPIDHSLSPVLHNAAFQALGIDWVYVAFRVAVGQGGAAIEAMRTLDLAGLSVTMPHKAEAALSVDRLGPVATTLGVVNTVSWSKTSLGPELVGESTDGAGFLDAVRGDDGFDPAGRSCVVVGAGGAARAVTLALAGAGAASVTVIARRSAPAELCAELAGPAGRAVLAGDRSGFDEAVSDASLVVNATPVGMASGDGMPLDLDAKLISASHYVADLIYSPAVTPLLVRARQAGASRSNGLRMLIHQAARQVEL